MQPKNAVNIDRHTPMLLPPDLRDWVDENDMVHFVIEAVEGMPLTNLSVNRRGSGSRQYPPKMMLSLLVYCYANGIFSSRRIENATYRDVAVRYLTANTHPDHDTICTFRRKNFDAIAQVFLQILLLAKEMGVLKVGTISVDGTHLAANADKNKSLRYDRACELEKQLVLDIQELMDQAEQTDQDEDRGPGSGRTLPDEIAYREKMLAKMRQARAELERRAKAQAQAEQAEYQGKVAAREKRQGLAKGGEIKKPNDKPLPQTQTNLTDADSRVMRKSAGSPYTQSYNAQAVVDADGSMLILGCDVIQTSSDRNALVPTVDTVDPALGKPERVLADGAYVNLEHLDELERRGVEVYIAVSREENGGRRRYDWRPESYGDKPVKVVTDPKLLRMREKLQTPQGKAIYRLRQQTVEPVFGIVKHCLKFRQFLLRGHEKVKGEWLLLCLSFNVKRLHRLSRAQTV